MSTYTKNRMAEDGLMVGLGYGRVATGKGYPVTAAKGAVGTGTRAKNIALFFAAPFIGLFYLLAFPFVGVALLAWIAGKAVMKNRKARTAALAIAAPFIGLALVTVGPIAGMGALAWTGVEALLKG